MLNTLKRALPFPVKQKIKRTINFLKFENKDRIFGDLAPLVPNVEDMFDGSQSFKMFKSAGDEFFKTYRDRCGLQPDDKILDVGSGNGRMALPLTQYLNQNGTYEGIEIVKAGVDWCSERVTPRFPNFHFQQIDVYNKHYNPGGKFQPSEYKFPFADESFTFSFLTSVFTHMPPADLENYLSEVSRVLKSGGRCLITYFLLNEESIRLIETGHSKVDFRFIHDNYRTLSRDVPEHAIGFDESWVRQLYEKYHLKIERIDYGFWCARKNPVSFQDMILATKI
jgi:ubiquinone/menaquinone biosynthesis C-methylase UbiE